MGQDRMISPHSLRHPRRTPHRTPAYHPRVEPLEARAVPAASSLTQDGFNDNTLDANLWLSGAEVNPAGRTAVREQNQRVEFIRAGNLATRAAFAPADPLEVAGSWTWSADGLPVNAHVLTRYKADPTSVTGVGVTFDPDDGLFIVAYLNGSGTVLARATLSVDPGDTYRFLVRDDGRHVSVHAEEVGGQGETVDLAAETSLATGGSQVAFRADAGTFLGTARLMLDDVRVGPPGAESGPASEADPGPTVPPIPPLTADFLAQIFAEVDAANAAADQRRHDLSSQIRVSRGPLRRNRRHRVFRQRLPFRNVGPQTLSGLRLALRRLPATARVRLGDGESLSAAEAVAGLELPQGDTLAPGASLTLTLELSGVGPRAARAYLAQLSGEE
jgi:hypothetical protein